nr:hypothetical protein CFP56_78417 [Quercus suber]
MAKGDVGLRPALSNFLLRPTCVLLHILRIASGRARAEGGSRGEHGRVLASIRAKIATNRCAPIASSFCAPGVRDMVKNPPPTPRIHSGPPHGVRAPCRRHHQGRGGGLRGLARGGADVQPDAHGGRAAPAKARRWPGRQLGRDEAAWARAEGMSDTFRSLLHAPTPAPTASRSLETASDHLGRGRRGREAHVPRGPHHPCQAPGRLAESSRPARGGSRWPREDNPGRPRPMRGAHGRIGLDTAPADRSLDTGPTPGTERFVLRGRAAQQQPPSPSRRHRHGLSLVCSHDGHGIPSALPSCWDLHPRSLAWPWIPWRGRRGRLADHRPWPRRCGGRMGSQRRDQDCLDLDIEHGRGSQGHRLGPSRCPAPLPRSRSTWTGGGADAWCETPDGRATPGRHGETGSGHPSGGVRGMLSCCPVPALGPPLLPESALERRGCARAADAWASSLGPSHTRRIPGFCAPSPMQTPGSLK